MDVRIVDRWRGVVQVPTKGPPFDDPAATLDGLMVGHTLSGAVEFECDREFLDALSKANPEGLVGHEKGIKTANGYILRTYKGVHVVVTGAPEV